MSEQKKSTPSQYFRESCLADRGYRFVEWEGDNTVWMFRGITEKSKRIVRVTPEGEVVNKAGEKVFA